MELISVQLLTLYFREAIRIVVVGDDDCVTIFLLSTFNGTTPNCIDMASSDVNDTQQFIGIFLHIIPIRSRMLSRGGTKEALLE